MSRTVAIVQARMSSTRLPGKVLLPLHGMPMIAFMCQRVRRARLVDALVLATSTDLADDALAAEAARHGIDCHRGDLADVLSRFEGAASAANADLIVRLTGDCPLIEPALIDLVVRTLSERGADYASNVTVPTYPDGLDVEAFTRAALTQAHADARLPSEREHVTPFIRNHPERFAQASVESVVDLSSLRWTVDHADDLAMVRELLAGFTPAQAVEADRFDLLRVLDRHPALADMNRHTRNEGYAKSLRQDPAGRPSEGTP